MLTLRLKGYMHEESNHFFENEVFLTLYLHIVYCTHSSYLSVRVASSVQQCR